MLLQTILFPEDRGGEKKKLYYNSQGKVKEKNGEIYGENKSKIDFFTYFNSFSVGKWKKYTEINQIYLMLELEGRFNIVLSKILSKDGSYKIEVISTHEFDLKKKEKVNLMYPEEKLESTQELYSFNIQILSEVGHVYGGGYYTDRIPLHKIRIAIDICTFCREGYVKKNIDLLKRKLLENENSPLYKKVEIIVVDNGQTLNKKLLSSEFVKIVYNKNAGGSGGFTRGIIETLNRKQDFTHILLMDDDAVIEPECILRTYAILRYLKRKYQNATIGGALLDLDKAYMQYVSGEKWIGEKIVGFNKGIDLREKNSIVENEKDEAINYNGWWYCCMPLENITEDNLPLPFFIHQDDIEYGKRICEKIILMNGICVWHENFERRKPSHLVYYNIRNLLIAISIHFPLISKYQIKKIIFRQFTGNILNFRYKDNQLAYMAVEDFLKGVSWIKETNPEELHNQIRKIGYFQENVHEQLEKSVLFQENYSIKKCVLTFNGWFLPPKEKAVVSVPMQASRFAFYRLKRVLIYDEVTRKGFLVEKKWIEFIKSYLLMLKSWRLIDKNYKRISKEYRNRKKELTSIQFWKKYLGINMEEFNE